MFSREIESRQRKFEQDATQQRRREKQKFDRLAQDRLAARQRREDADRRLRQKQLLLEEQRRQEEERKEQLREINRGIYLEKRLMPVSLTEDAAASYGIRRWMDKVVLPASMSDELMEQEAFKNGAWLFQLKSQNGRSTHVGVLKFTATDGTVQIPPHVQRSLFDQGNCEGIVIVSYKRLQDGTFARLQPIKRGFHESVGDDIKEILESTLSQYSTLTEGDVIEVRLPNEETHQLKVVELSPASAVRILETDLEVDVLPSAEIEKEIKNKLKSAGAMSFGTSNRLQKYKIAKHSEQPAASSQEQQEINKSDLEPMEPEVEDHISDVIHCSIRFPDGSSAKRRFLLDDPLGKLFHFVTLEGMDRSLEAGFKLMTRYPSCVMTREEHSGETFRKYGFDRRQVFFVERC